MPVHPARAVPFADLWDRLQAAKADRLVTEAVGGDGLRLYCYTNACVYDRRWDDTTVLARGLVVDPPRRRVVATPFPKFFNLGERGEPVPDRPFEAFEKVDGSLVVLFHHAGRWRAATKGSLDSDQARWAERRLAAADLSPLEPGATYLAEAVYPENRVVVRYPDAGLVLLGAYDPGGAELPSDAVADLGGRLGWRVAGRRAFASVSDLVAQAKRLPATEEGFVLRFADGLRLKVKGDEYLRLHRAMTGVTPLAVWEAMAKGDDLAAVRRELPEEFWADFDAIVGLIERAAGRLVADVRQAAEGVAGLSDKEVGLRLDRFPERVRKHIFAYRAGKLSTGRGREAVLRAVRPAGNALDGYRPSSAVRRVLDDAG